MIQGGRFKARTNFSVEVLFTVSTPEGVPEPLSGFVFSVHTAHDGVQRLVYSDATKECTKLCSFARERFVAKDDLQTLKAFVKAAGRSRALRQGVGWTMERPYPKEFLGGPNRRKKVLVTCVGRQPGSNT